MSLTGLALFLDVVAAYRLTRLATADVITQPLRERLIRWAYRRDDDALPPPMGGTARTHPTRWQEHAEDDPWAPKLAVLVTCRWCSSIWVAALVAAARWTIPTAWTPIAWALTAASGAALLARMEDR